jgi:hypothetical protein
VRYRTSDAHPSELHAQFDDWHAACLVAGMPPLFPSKRGPLGSAQARLAPALDLVELWKTRVRWKLARQAELAGPRPTLLLQLDWRVLPFAAAVGFAGGPFGAVRSLVLLLSILLVHEGSRALLARVWGRSARALLSLAGGHTEISGPELHGARAVAFTLVGSLGNGLVAVVLQALSQRVHDASFALMLRDLSTGHAIWAIAQALPLLPFRAGTELSRRLSPSLRSGHAIASGGLAVGAVFAIFSVPKSPLLLFALLFVAVSSVRAAREAFREEFDRQHGLAKQLEAALMALREGNQRRAMALARATLELARSSELRKSAWSTIAWAGIGARDPFATHAALQQLPQSCIDVHLLASYLACCNRNPEAQELLQEARRLGQYSTETSKLLIEVLFTQGDRATCASTWFSFATSSRPIRHARATSRPSPRSVTD